MALARLAGRDAAHSGGQQAAPLLALADAPERPAASQQMERELREGLASAHGAQETVGPQDQLQRTERQKAQAVSHPAQGLLRWMDVPRGQEVAV